MESRCWQAPASVRSANHPWQGELPGKFAGPMAVHAVLVIGCHGELHESVNMVKGRVCQGAPLDVANNDSAAFDGLSASMPRCLLQM